ncbi:MAG: acyltransferase family protein [Chloroflexota bacterium]
MGLSSLGAGRAERDLRIDIIKGIAALGVIFHHALDRPHHEAIGAPLYTLGIVEVFMVVVGFNGALALASRGVTTLAAAYHGPTLLRALLRLLPAYLVIWLVQAPLHPPGASRQEYLVSLLTGGWGWGGYFVPVIITHALVFPLIYLFAQRAPGLLLPVAFALDMGFQLASYSLGLPDQWHERIYLRYLFVVALGIWLASARPSGKTLATVGAFSLALWIFPLEYVGLRLPLNEEWASRAAPAAGWALALVAVGLANLPQQSGDAFWRVLAELGRASYHIFLLQGVYFWHFFNRAPDARQYGQAVVLVVALAFLGWLFYRTEAWLRGGREPRPEAAQSQSTLPPLAPRPAYTDPPRLERRGRRSQSTDHSHEPTAEHGSGKR